MEKFWGVEVKNGQSLKVSPGDGLVLRISQASLGELKGEKGKENVNLFVNVGGKKLVLGTLITNKLPQHHFDLLFDRDFELSHNWKSGSVYYYGYRATKTFEDELLVEESDGKKTAPLLNHSVEDHARVMHDGNKVTPLIGNEAKKVPPTNKLNMEILKKVTCSICNRLLGSTKGLEDHTKAKHGITESMVSKEQHTDAERATASIEKKSDAGTEPVKIAETCKDVNTNEEEETTFEDIMTDDDNIADPQVVSSKKRSLESVESSTVTSVPRKKRPARKKAKVTPGRTDLVGNEATRVPPTVHVSNLQCT